MSEPGDLLTLLGDEAAPAPKSSDAQPKRSPARRKKAEPPAAPLLDASPPLAPATALPEGRELSSALPDGCELSSALPSLIDLADIRERALEIVRPIDLASAEQIPETLDFPPEDDPFIHSEEEWEVLWYGSRESALRVYLNMRVEFRRHLARAAAGEPNDLKPWTYWAFNGKRPADGEPVYGLTDERRQELGWIYPGPATDFRIYRELDGE